MVDRELTPFRRYYSRLSGREGDILQRNTVINSFGNNLQYLQPNLAALVIYLRTIKPGVKFTEINREELDKLLHKIDMASTPETVAMILQYYRRIDPENNS